MRDDRGSALGLSAAALATLTLAVYLRIIVSQGQSDWSRVAVVASLIGAGALGAAIATRLDGPRRTAVLTVAGAVLVVLGLVGIFSVGLPLLVAGGLAVAGARRSATRGRA